MKLVHYVLIAQQLTGDSEILFFPTPTQAMDKYRELTDPLLSTKSTLICLNFTDSWLKSEAFRSVIP